MRNTLSHKNNTLLAGLSLAQAATVGSFLGSFTLGVAENMKGPTLPSLLSNLNLRYEQGSAILFGIYLGYLFATPIAGGLVGRFGARKVILLAAGCMFAGSLLYSLSSTVLLLSAALFITGLGLGSMNVAGGSLIIAHHANNQGRYLNQFGFFHSLASTLAPLIAGLMLAAQISWRMVYAVSLVPSLALLIYFAVVKVSTPQPETQKPATDQRQPVQVKAFSATMLPYYLLPVLCSATENGAASWMAVFLQKVKGLPVDLASTAVAGFFACIMAGRFLSSFAVERIGYMRAIVVAALGVVVCLALGIYGPAALTICLPLAGLFVSLIFPTATAAASKAAGCGTGKAGEGRVLGLVYAAAGLGGMFGAWSVGFAADRIGMQGGFALIIVTATLLMLLAGGLLRFQSHKKQC